MHARSEPSSTVDDEFVPEAEYRDRLRALPPSAKLVAKVMEGTEPLTHAELVEETLLPDRTVRYALERLEGVGLVESRLSFRDARKHVYSLCR